MSSMSPPSPPSPPSPVVHPPASGACLVGTPCIFNRLFVQQCTSNSRPYPYLEFFISCTICQAWIFYYWGSKTLNFNFSFFLVKISHLWAISMNGELALSGDSVTKEIKLSSLPILIFIFKSESYKKTLKIGKFQSLKKSADKNWPMWECEPRRLKWISFEWKIKQKVTWW